MIAIPNREHERQMRGLARAAGPFCILQSISWHDPSAPLFWLSSRDLQIEVPVDGATCGAIENCGGSHAAYALAFRSIADTIPEAMTLLDCRLSAVHGPDLT